MNKRGQAFGALILLFIGAIVALALLPAIAENAQEISRTVVVENNTITMPAAASSLDLDGQELLDTPLVTNATGGEAVPASNYTVAEVVSTTTGVKTVNILSNGGLFEGESVNISYTYGVDGYADNAGARSLGNFVALFAALGLLGFAVFYGIGRAGWMK